MKCKICNSIFDSLKIRIREILNPCFGKKRTQQLINPHFTIISNNCWAGHVYRYFNLPYDSPTIGLYFFAADYIKFVSNLRHYIETDIKFIKYTKSKYKEQIVNTHKERVPIGLLDDVEIFFLHYKSEDECLQKWNRRKERIHWNSLYIKMSEQNLCSYELLQKFDELQYKDKFVFVSKEYGLNSQVVFNDWIGHGEVTNDTTNFNKYIDIINWLNHKPFRP